MIEKYIEGIFVCLLIYITVFTVFTGHRQHKWSKPFRKKIKRIYFAAWIIPYFIYLYCIFSTPSTRVYFLEHIFFGAFFHAVFAIFAYRASMP